MKFRSFAVLTVAVGLLSSQVSAGVGFGIKGGLNLSKAYGEDVDVFFGDDLSMRPGLAVGAILQLGLSDFFAITPEVLFSAKGAQQKDGDDAIKISFRYIEIPVLFQLLIPAGPVIPQLYVGPAIAFRAGVNAKIKTDLKGFEDLIEESEKEMEELYKEYTKAVDFGLAFGGGLGIKAGPGKLVLDYRVTLGLIKVAKLTDEDKEHGATNDDLPKARNMAMTISGGYLFEF